MSLIKPRRHFQAVREILSLLTRHRDLTLELTRREITERYAGQVLGAFWAVGHPLALMGIYVLIFNFVFKIKLSENFSMPLDYAAYILSGLIPWMTFQETLMKSAAVMTQNQGLVKQVVFPIEILPVKGVLSSSITQIVATAILLFYIALRHQQIYTSWLLLPILFTIQLMAMLGFSFLLAAAGTYLRDLKDIIQVFCLAGMYLMPVFYLPAWVPGMLKPMIYANPFSYLIWCYQDIFYYGSMRHPLAWIIFPVFSLFIFSTGYRVFRRAKPYLAGVL